MNKRLISFFVCVCLAVFFWLFLSLSKRYVNPITLPLSYIHQPNDKVIINKLPSSITMEMEATGFRHLRYMLSKSSKKILIDLADAKTLSNGISYLSPNEKIKKLTAQFDDRTRLISVFPKRIEVQFKEKKKKTVPIKANIDIHFESNHQLKEAIILRPKDVTISGAQEFLENIDTLETEKINLSSVNESVQTSLSILALENADQIELSANKIDAQINVEKYTQGSLKLPIQIKNLPEQYSLKTFPLNVTVQYNVGFSNFKSIMETDFTIEIDYLDLKKGQNKLPVHVTKQPSTISALKVIPKKVEFILRKK